MRSVDDGNEWTTQPKLATAPAPPAAGSPITYSSNKTDRRIAYRGTDGHIHELSRQEKATGDLPWKHNNLTARLQLPLASCDPSVVVVDGAPHIVYVDEDSRIHELWFDEEWIAKGKVTSSILRRRVQRMIFAFILMDTLMAYATVGWQSAVVLLSLLIPTWIASRFAPMT